MPNLIAYLALAISPIVVAVLISRLRPDRAIIWSLLLCYLFLPEPPAAFDLPLIPGLDKHNIPALAAFLLMMGRHGTGGSLLPNPSLGKALLLTYVLAPVITALGNSEPVFYGQIALPGLGIKDAAALVLEHCMHLMPFLLARQHLANGGALRELLFAFVVCGLIYSLFMLVEMRLSPQFNMWIYGYYQGVFATSIREGGYRPTVFLIAGLWVTFFMMTAVVSAVALSRWPGTQQRFKLALAAVYLSLIIVMAKSLGALIFTVLLVPMVLLLPSRTQVRVALVIGSMALAYPVMKGLDLVPEDYMLSEAAKIDENRADSLAFRFENEETLLDRASLKPVFGWGSWGRNHILDPQTGRILTVTDGRWIITIGVFGWIGFFAEFGLLLLPLMLIARQLRGAGADSLSPLVGPVCLILAINLVDMIPNATLTPLTWLIAGALTGYAENPRKVPEPKTASLAGKLRWRSVM